MYGVYFHLFSFFSSFLFFIHYLLLRLFHWPRLTARRLLAHAAVVLARPPSHRQPPRELLACAEHLPVFADTALRHAPYPRTPQSQIAVRRRDGIDFQSLDAAADLARASAACSSFRRVVSERRFLRRFRSLHSPPLLGFMSRDIYEYQGFLPIEPPHRSAQQARQLVQAADFTFSFLPDPNVPVRLPFRRWRICHASDGRVLLSRRISTKINFKVFSSKHQFQDFLVCDPLHRRCVMIPRIPDNLMASAPLYAQHLLPVLAPASESDEEESFRVIYTVQLKDRVVGFIFSSCNQTWRGILTTVSLPNGYTFTEYKPYYAHRCFYWMYCFKGYSLMLDTSEMEFSTIHLPSHNFSERTIAEATDGRLGFLAIGDGTIDLYSKNWPSNGVGAQKWQYDKLIRLPKDFGIKYSSWGIVGTVGRYVALLASSGSCPELQKFEYFVLNTKTFLLEKVCTSKNDEVLYDLPYARFPPLLALPSI